MVEGESMMGLSVITWLWRPPRSYRSQFTPLHVNLMRERVAEHCTLPHEFVCVTDQPADLFHPRVRVVPLWKDLGHLPSAMVNGPSCYRRLRVFAPEAHELLGVPAGHRIVSLDLDCVPVGGPGSLDSLWSRPESFVGWRATARAPTCGSMFLLKLGSFPNVWTEFDHARALRRARNRVPPLVGTDQAWMAYMLVGQPLTGSWTTRDGVYSFKNDCLKRADASLPAGARIVFFHGRPDPWDAPVRRSFPWIAQHYPLGLPMAQSLLGALSEPGVNCHA